MRIYRFFVAKACQALLEKQAKQKFDNTEKKGMFIL